MSAKCSCGKPFDNHLGVMALCAENHELRQTSHAVTADLVLKWETIELIGLMQAGREELERRARHAVDVVQKSRRRS